MPLRHWKLHAGRLVLGAALVFLLGLFTGHLATIFAAAGVIYLAWTGYNLQRLHAWLKQGVGSPPESLGIWSDIFDRIHELQKHDLDQQSQYQAVIREFQDMSDAFPDATLVIDPDDNLTWFNGAARHLLGLKFPDDLSKPVTNLLRDPDFADWITVGEQVQEPFEMASPLDANVRLNARMVHYRAGQRLLVLRDITDIHNLERIRRDFVANVSHELRTPLTVLSGYLEFIQGQGPEDVQTVVGRMQDQARQMQAMLNDLLELSRLQSGEFEKTEQRVDVPAIVMQLKEQCEEISQGKHRLRFEIEPGLCLLGNAADLESAFRNLLNNAIHYTPEGGRITVRWGMERDGIRFSVTDTGIGIPKRDIPRLTERFYRVGADRSRHSGGTGLGLSIVKHVLNTHDARLQIDSELGEGSVFSCVFPLERRFDRVSPPL